MAVARAEKPVLIICDYMMEKGDGYEILLALRAEPLMSKIPFVLMTGSPERAGIKPGSGRSLEEVLLKPVQPAELMRIVETQLQKSGASAATHRSPPDPAALAQLEDSLLRLED